MGGAYGHLTSPQEMNHYSFSDLYLIMERVLNGTLTYPEEKTDGSNLLVTWKNNTLLAARSKSHLKNYGQNALNSDALISKFKDRNLEYAYGHAMNDLNSALSAIDETHRQEIFNEGQRWLSIEVLHSEWCENIISYGVNQLRLHGTFEYCSEGNPQKQINKTHHKRLLSHIEDKGHSNQNIYSILPLEYLHPIYFEDFSPRRKAEWRDKFYDLLDGNEFETTIADIKIGYFTKILSSLDFFRIELIRRWVYDDKSTRIDTIIKGIPEDLKKRILSIDKNIISHRNKAIEHIEAFFLKLGAELVSNLTSYMAKVPFETETLLKKNVNESISYIQKSQCAKSKTELERQLQRLANSGGMDMIKPCEGITFFYGDDFLKLTGTFGPVNRIINTARQL